MTGKWVRPETCGLAVWPWSMHQMAFASTFGGCTRRCRPSDVPEPSSEGASLDALPQWIEEHQFDPRQTWWWPVSARVEVPARKITFADLGPELLEDVMRATAEEFRRYESFVGFAIHHAESYRALTGQ